MKAAAVIRQQIQKHGPDSLWRLTDFGDLPSYAVAQTLSRLARSGFLTRVRKGIYYFPKKTVLGPSKPSTSAVLEKALQMSKSPVAFSGGTASFQNLGITTQIPAIYTVLSDQSSRTVRIGGGVARIRRRSFDHLKGVTQQDIWILDVLRNINRVPDATSTDAVSKIIHAIQNSPGTLKRLLRFSYGEPPRVRALIGAIASQLDYQGPGLKRLKRSLNPLTHYKLGVISVLPTAQYWNIL